MFGLIPLILAVLIGSHARREDAAFAVLDLAWMGAALVTWTVLLVLAVLLLRRRIGARALPRFEFLASASLLGLHAWWCGVLGWPPRESSLLVLLPFIVGLIVAWTCLGVLVRAVTGTAHHLPSFVWLRLKLGVLPLLVAIGLFDAGEWLLLRSHPLLVALPPWAAWLLLQAAAVGLLLVVAVLVPPLLVLAWGARPLPPGRQRELVEAAVARSGVRVHRILRWPTGRGRLFNAAAIGLVSRFRYVLLTDHLLENLTDDELRGVLGHELGHLRRRHLQLYLVFIVTASFLALLLTPWVVAAAAALPGAGALGQQQLELLATIVVWLTIFGAGFGPLSRACERQADLEGVALCEDPRTMQAALTSVARLTGMDPETPSWRHRPIAERIAFLERTRLDPHQEARHHRLLMKFRTLIWFFLILGLILVLAQAAGSRLTLQERVADDADLNRALLTAVEHGDQDLLQRWVVGREHPERAAYAQSVLGLFIDYGFAADERKLRAYIPYLMPFRSISTGSPELDLELKNTIAYSLASGSAPPTPEDLAILRDMLGGLIAAHERAAKEAAPVLVRLSDTIGCIHYVLGEHEEATGYFRQALEVAAKREAEDPRDEAAVVHPTRAEILQLFKARLDACARQAALLPRYWNGIVE